MSNDLKYTIVLSDNSFSLSEKVNEYIKRGWKPQGGICAEGNCGSFFQAMVKSND